MHKKIALFSFISLLFIIISGLIANLIFFKLETTLEKYFILNITYIICLLLNAIIWKVMEKSLSKKERENIPVMTNKTSNILFVSILIGLLLPVVIVTLIGI